MRIFKVLFLTMVALGLHANAQTVVVDGGTTSVLLDTDTLSTAASLDLSSVSGDVIAPGALGDDSVAFQIVTPSEFSYTPGEDFLSTFTGTVEHEGSVFFNSDSVEVGDFTIGFDGARAGDDRTGFFVESTTGIEAILFDIADINPFDPAPRLLTIGGDLLVSSEFGTFLFDNGLSATNLTGADVGDALILATAVPEPSTFAVLGLTLAGVGLGRRRRKSRG